MLSGGLIADAGRLWQNRSFVSRCLYPQRSPTEPRLFAQVELFRLCHYRELGLLGVPDSASDDEVGSRGLFALNKDRILSQEDCKRSCPATYFLHCLSVDLGFFTNLKCVETTSGSNHNQVRSTTLTEKNHSTHSHTGTSNTPNTSNTSNTDTPYMSHIYKSVCTASRRHEHQRRTPTHAQINHKTTNANQTMRTTQHPSEHTHARMRARSTRSVLFRKGESTHSPSEKCAVVLAVKVFAIICGGKCATCL